MRSSASTPASTRQPGAGSRVAAERLGAGTFCLTYADGVADIDLAALVGLAPARGAHRDDDGRAPLQPVGDRGHRRRASASAGSTRSRGWTTGSTAASSCLRAGRSSTTSMRRACSSRSRCGVSRRKGSSNAYRHTGFWDCMDTYKDAVVLNDLWEGGAPPGRLAAGVDRRRPMAEVGSGHGRSRVRRRLARKGAAGARRTVISLDKGRPERAGLDAAAAGDRGGGRGCRGRPERRRADGAPARRAPGGFRLPPRRGDDRRHRAGLAGARDSRRTCAGRGRSSTPAAEPSVERIVVASSDKAYGPTMSFPTARTSRSGRRPRTRPRRRPPTSSRAATVHS